MTNKVYLSARSCACITVVRSTMSGIFTSMCAMWSSRGAGCFRRKVCTEVLHPGGVLKTLLSPLAARLQSDVGIKSKAFLYHTSAWNVFCLYYKYTCEKKNNKYQNIGTEAIVISLATKYMTEQRHFNIQMEGIH